MRGILPADCARARQQLSLRMDLELSEFEHALLDAHVERCADCRVFGEGLTELTARLRTVQVEDPPVSFQPPRVRSRFDVVLAGTVRAGSAAAAVAVVAITGLIALNGSNNGVPSTASPQIRSVLDLHERQLQALDGTRASRTRKVPHGLAAAERATLRPTRSSRRLQGRR